MIYGPDSTGWRSEAGRHRASVRRARLGLLVAVVYTAVFWGGVAAWWLV